MFGKSFVLHEKKNFKCYVCFSSLCELGKIGVTVELRRCSFFLSPVPIATFFVVFAFQLDGTNTVIAVVFF